jgi:hypothetical protein
MFVNWSGGTLVLDASTDHPPIKRGDPIEFFDGFTEHKGIVTRRRKQRDGSIKLWIEAT